MTFNWKKTALILTDILLGVYLVLAVSAFNRPDALASVCTNVDINIVDGVVDGFLNEGDIRQLLQQYKLNPIGQPIDNIKTRDIEERLQQSPYVKSVQCYKAQNGHVRITLTQRLPVMRVKAQNGEDYYIDEHGSIMPNTKYVSDLVIATGNISHQYAQKVLTHIGNFVIHNKLWRSQIEQFNVLPDGSLEMVPLVGDHIVYLGRPVNIPHKLERLEKFYRYGLSQAGWNKYSHISLEFDNQIICKKHQTAKRK